MLYDVDQAASKLNVSKQSIYNKIKLKEYKDKIIHKAGKIYIDDDLLNLIKDGLKVKNEVENQVESNNMGESLNQEIAIDEDSLLNLNKDLFNALINQLREKDIQIQELHNRLASEQELTKNMQVLQLKQQPPTIKELEAHFQNLDNKLINLRNEIHQDKDHEENISLFKRLFKK